MIQPARLTVLCLAGGLSLLAAFLAPGADAAEERLCLLKRIEATKNGVNLYFTAARQVMLMHDDQEGDLYLIDAAARETEGSATAPKVMHSLPLRAGEEAVLRTTADERCSITLSQRNGKVGVEIELSGPGWEGRRTAPAGTAAGASASTPKSTNPRFGKFLPAEP
jgi:hypothetical protein